jgi:hypothetical protein
MNNVKCIIYGSQPPSVALGAHANDVLSNNAFYLLETYPC